MLDIFCESIRIHILDMYQMFACWWGKKVFLWKKKKDNETNRHLFEILSVQTYLKKSTSPIIQEQIDALLCPLTF